MYRTMTDFQKHWQEEVADTQKVLAAVPDSALAVRITAAHRDLARLAWHLVESVISLPAQIGVEVDGPALGPNGLFAQGAPATMVEIAEAYARVAGSLSQAVAHWTDGELLREDDMFGQRWMRGYTLQALVMHQAHHRGQMTVLLRQAGLLVPEFYGPTLEGWAQMGAPEPVV